MKIKVISADIDGADLRRQMVASPYHARCDGRQDNEQLQDAVNRLAGGARIAIAADDWERIFGGEHGG